MKKLLIPVLVSMVFIIAMAMPAFADWGNNVTETTEFDKVDGMYIFDNTSTRAYLFVGDDSALVIDTMYESSNVYDEVRKITDLPLEVVLTHGHPDHIGGLAAFAGSTVYIDEDDVYMLPAATENIKTIKDGDKISVGDFEFEVIEIPGHTRGSVALLDKKSGVLITGDSVQEGPVMMFDEECDMETYAASMKKLMSYSSDAKYIFAGHHDYPNGPEFIEYCYKDATAYLNGELEPVAITSWNGDATVYYGEHVSFQLPALETVAQTPETGGNNILLYTAVILLFASVIAGTAALTVRKNR